MIRKMVLMLALALAASNAVAVAEPPMPDCFPCELSSR
jgi:hypothetical protein